MTLLQLEYFRVMSRTLHYSEAARELHTTQPNLSYAMKELEKELGAPLFEKQGRRVRLSAFGMQFACYADKALRTLAGSQGSASSDEDASRTALHRIYRLNWDTIFFRNCCAASMTHFPWFHCSCIDTFIRIFFRDC